MSPARVVEVTVVGNTAQLEASLERSGVVAASSSAKIKASYAEAGAAAAKAAEAAGASADEQAAAAGRAAAAQVDANARITRAQQVAADAAAKAAEAAGLSADEQVAAARRAAEAQGMLEEQSRATAVSAGAAGFAIGDSFEKGTDKAGGAITKLGSKLEGWGVPFAGGLVAVGKGLDEADTKGQHFTKTMSALGGATLLVGATAFAAVGAEGVHLAADFQKSVASIAANSDIPVAAATKIGNAFLDTAGYMTVSGNAMAKAFAPVAGQLKMTEGAALNTAQALKFMKTAADLAEGSQTDLGTATASLSQVMQSFHLPLTDAAKASDLLFNVSRSLNVPIDQVSAAVDKLHGRLGILMPSMSDVGGLMIALGQHGIMGSRGIQVAQTALTKLTDGSQNTQTVLAELGVHIDNSQGKFIGMANVINQLRPALSDLNQKSQEVALTTLFGSSAWQVMGQIVGSGVPKFNQATDAASKMGTAHKAAALQAKTLDGQVKILLASLEDIATKLGQVLIPVLEKMGQALSNTISWMEQHKAVAEALAGVIGGVLSVAVAVFAEQKMVAFGRSIQAGLGDLQKLGGWITSNLPDMEAKLSGLGGGMSKGVQTGAAESEATLQEAKAPLAAAATTDGEAVAAGMNAGGDLGMTTAVTGAEAELGAAKAGIAEKAAIDGTAAGGAFATALATAATVGLAAAVGYALGKVANDILGTNPQNPYNTKGSTAQQILAGNTTLVSGERLRGPGEVHGRYSVAKDLYGDNETTAQVNATIKALQATGEFPGGKYVPPPATSQGNVLSNFGGGIGGTAVTGSGGSQGSPQALITYLESRGFTLNAAAGIAGNVGGAEDENFNAATVQGGALSSTIVPGQGYGLAQWTTQSRQAGLQALAAKMGQPVDSAAVQYAYIAKELNANPALKNQLNTASTPAQAAQIAELQYESPKYPGQTLAQREAAATKYAGGTYSGAAVGVTVPGYGGVGGLPTGHKNLENPTIAASSQKTVDSLNLALKTAVDKYAGAASSATSPQLKAIDETFKTKIDELKESFDKASKGLSGPDLETLITTDKGILARDEANAASQVKSATTMESIDATLKKQIGAYQSAAESASSSVVSSLDNHFAGLVQAVEKGFTSPNQAEAVKLQLAQIENQAKAQVGLGTSGAGLLSSIQSAISGSSFTTLQQLTNAGSPGVSSRSLGLPGGATVGGTGASQSHQDFTQLVKELNATHSTVLHQLASQLESTYKVAETAKNNILIGDTQQEAAAQTQKITAVWQDASDEAVQAIKDTAQSMTDMISAATQAVTDAAQTYSDAASGQATSIADQAQTTVDKLGERGLYGLNLVAQEMTVAADQQKTMFDAQINALQQNVDTTTATQDAIVAKFQQSLDNTTQTQDALVGNATAHLDAVTATQNAAITLAQSKVNEGVVGAQSALAAVQGTAANAEAVAAQQLEQAQATAGQSEAQANAALSGAQATAASVVAQAQAALSNATGAAQIAEAQSQAEIAIEKEEAATRFAGSGTVINITGLALTDAAAVASEVAWVQRSQFTAPVA